MNNIVLCLSPQLIDHHVRYKDMKEQNIFITISLNNMSIYFVNKTHFSDHFLHLKTICFCTSLEVPVGVSKGHTLLNVPVKKK